MELSQIRQQVLLLTFIDTVFIYMHNSHFHVF